jgi:hypothetical protein
MRRNILLTAGLFATLSLGVTAAAYAQRLDAPQTKDVYFTFSESVMVPNMTLPAGKYLFRVVGDGRTIVQIYTGDRAKLLHTAMSVQTARSDQPEKPEIRMIESAAEGPIAVGTWWYPEMRQGWEFVYPREQAMKLAKTAKQPILTTAENTAPEDVGSSDLVRLQPSGEQSPYSASSDSAPAPLTGTARVGEIAAADADANANRVADAMTSRSAQGAAQGSAPANSAMAQSAQAQPTRAALPQTASRTPAVGFAGLLLLMAAFGLRLWRRDAA